MVNVGDLRFHVQRLGPKNPEQAKLTVVMVHGLLYDSLASYYFTLGPVLAEAGIDVIMYDLRGHGRSTRPQEGYELELFVEDLNGLLDELGVDWPVHLVGNSFGGTIGLSFATTHPERAASVVVIESQPPVQSWRDYMTEGLTDAMEKLQHEYVYEWIEKTHGAHNARLSRAAYKILLATTIARDVPRSRIVGDDVPGLVCPVLGVYGSESTLVVNAEMLAAVLPVFRAEILPGLGHSVLVEQPVRTTEIVRDWVLAGCAEALAGAGEGA